jgi:hypothetical protein
MNRNRPSHLCLRMELAVCIHGYNSWMGVSVFVDSRAEVFKNVLFCLDIVLHLEHIYLESLPVLAHVAQNDGLRFEEGGICLRFSIFDLLSLRDRLPYRLWESMQRPL